MNISLCREWFVGAAISVAAVALIHTAAAAPAAPASKRVEDGLLVLYDFTEQRGDVVHDRSRAGQPLDLRIDKPGASQWRGGALVVSASVSIASPGPATKIIHAIKRSEALTLEAWLKPANDQQGGPARILSLSANPVQRNFTLGQDGGRYDVRLRSTATSDNGIPSIASPKGSLGTQLTHVVYTRDKSGAVRLYLDGKQAGSGKVAGSLSNWSDAFGLVLANELTGDRPWAGELHLVAIYSRALSPREVAQNHAAGGRTADPRLALLPPALKRQVDFVKDVQPILRQHCFECHAKGNEKGGLNLGMKARVLEGGKHGPVLVPGDSGASRLIYLVAALDEDDRMPPEKNWLTKEQVGVLRAWVDQGMNWPAGADVLDPRTEQARSHWAFQPLHKVDPPAVKDQRWVGTPIDRFILASLESHHLSPTAPADAGALIRRVSYDVAGLPPTPQEVADFRAAYGRDRQAAVDALVDRLLASPRYGERWGRHWLDVARYADSDGQEADRDRPDAYHYRDFVIRALNDDLPFDTFLRWQLAGDEFDPTNPEALAATGFLIAGPHTVLEKTFLEEERLRNRYNELDDMLSTIGSGMLALTVGCARCHDHKYDAISSREYYRMLSALHSGERAEVPLGGKGEKALVFRDGGAQPVTTWLFHRADFYDRQQPVQLGFINVLMRGRRAADYLAAARKDRPLNDSTYQRKAMALWMTDVEHGAGALAARVIVNRVWQHHFGQGLARTVSDFGVRGQTPTHPQLLEWLSADFVAHGWKLKRLHRMILTSAVYQQGAAFDASRAAADSENRLLWRVAPQRLESEILRDAMLAVSGTLNLQAYGPAFKPAIAPEAMAARNLKSPYPADVKDSPAVRRRSVYMFHKRVIPYPLMQAFDRPDSLQSCGRRDVTTVAPQALALLNDRFVRTCAADFARRLLDEAGGDQQRWVTLAFQLALSRPPSDSERAASLAFVRGQIQRRQQRDKKRPTDEVRRAALTDFCQSMFGLNEFIYVD